VASSLVATLAAAPAHAARLPSVTLDVPHYQQHTRNWCWIAAARMAISYFRRTLRQCEIMERGYGLPRGACCSNEWLCDRPGSEEQLRAAVEFFGGQIVETRGQPPSSRAVYRTLKEDKVIIALLQPFPGGGGHAVVVRGIRLETHSEGRVAFLLVNDPIKPEPVRVRYDDFVQTWRRTIVVASD
jgi:hypothetical protein